MKRLRDIVERAHLEARDGALHFRHRRDDDDGRLGPARDDFAEQRDAVHFRHPEVGNDERDGSLLELGEGLDAGTRLRAREPFALEQAREHAAQPRLVIHDETSHSSERWHGPAKV